MKPARHRDVAEHQVPLVAQTRGGVRERAVESAVDDDDERVDPAYRDGLPEWLHEEVTHPERMLTVQQPEGSRIEKREVLGGDAVGMVAGLQPDSEAVDGDVLEEVWAVGEAFDGQA